MSLRTLSSIKELEAEAWDALWKKNTSAIYPFVKHSFLSTLESSACTGVESGWQTHHLIYEENSQTLAALPLYLKYDSWGEYVFDWSWADAYQRNGLDYYPKLLSAIPFTPATGPRLGFIEGLDQQKKHEITKALIDHCLSSGKDSAVSGFHLLFPNETDSRLLKSSGLLERRGYQFHWFNKDYKDFDTFLSNFSSRKRKNIKRERDKVQQQKLQIVVEKGSEISDERWKTFYIYYHTTYLKRSGRYGYLTQEFFQSLSKALGEQVVLISALQDEKPLAMALFFRDDETLYGRYWGCNEEIEFLHFELCYYQGIEYAIKNKLKRFDPGAQGEHKIQRGFTPVYTRSWHQLHDERFNQAVKTFLSEEKIHLEYYMQQAREALPFKQDFAIVPADTLL